MAPGAHHKLARGLPPVATHSAHWLADGRFADAVRHFLKRESVGIAHTMEELNEKFAVQGDLPSPSRGEGWGEGDRRRQHAGCIATAPSPTLPITGRGDKAVKVFTRPLRAAAPDGHRFPDASIRCCGSRAGLRAANAGRSASSATTSYRSLHDAALRRACRTAPDGQRGAPDWLSVESGMAERAPDVRPAPPLPPPARLCATVAASISPAARIMPLPTTARALLLQRRGGGRPCVAARLCGGPRSDLRP